MVRCVDCGSETELYQAGVPTCTVCAAERKGPMPTLTTPSVRSRLVHALEEATLELDDVAQTHG